MGFLSIMFYKVSKVLHKHTWFSVLLTICSFQLIKHAASKSRLKFGVHGENNFQNLLLVKMENPAASWEDASFLTAFSPRSEAAAELTALDSGPGALQLGSC